MAKEVSDEINIKTVFYSMDIGCDSVGRLVAFDTRSPWFESKYWQNLF